MLVNPVRLIKDRMGHPLEAYLELEVRDANGKLLTFKRAKAKSLLAQFLGLIKGQFSVSSTPVIDTSGTSRNYPPQCGTWFTNIVMNINAGAGDSSFGLVVGSSDAQNTINQYAMGAIIPHGNGANQISYGTHSIENPSNPPGTNNWIFRIIRTFSNNSGSSITIKEIGIIVKCYDEACGTIRSFLIARDVISPVTVPTGSTLTIRYILKITVS
jgi:hypothetical protein